jgi:hypothetical protein
MDLRLPPWIERLSHHHQWVKLNSRIRDQPPPQIQLEQLRPCTRLLLWLNCSIRYYNNVSGSQKRSSAETLLKHAIMSLFSYRIGASLQVCPDHTCHRWPHFDGELSYASGSDVFQYNLWPRSVVFGCKWFFSKDWGVTLPKMAIKYHSEWH